MAQSAISPPVVPPIRYRLNPLENSGWLANHTVSLLPNDIDWHLPQRSWDTHVHVFDPANYPYVSTRAYSPLTASYGNLLGLNARMSIAHMAGNIVLVQPSPYGTDNSLILEMLANHDDAEQGRRLRSIAVIDPRTVQDDELNRMHELGVRGIRINAEASGNVAGSDELRSAISEGAWRVAGQKDWKCQLYISGGNWDHIADVVNEVPVKFIADHQGGMKGTSYLPNGTDVTKQPGLASLVSLAKSGKVFVKISGLYRSSKLTTGGYDDLEQLIRFFAREIPDQLIWGSDWPCTGSDASRTAATSGNPEAFRNVDHVAVLKNIREWVGPKVWWKMTVETPAAAFL